MLFSIVVPVYNVEKYIEDCLESIIYQIDDEKTMKLFWWMMGLQIEADRFVMNIREDIQT